MYMTNHYFNFSFSFRMWTISSSYILAIDNRVKNLIVTALIPLTRLDVMPFQNTAKLICFWSSYLIFIHPKICKWLIPAFFFLERSHKTFVVNMCVFMLCFVCGAPCRCVWLWRKQKKSWSLAAVGLLQKLCRSGCSSLTRSRFSITTSRNRTQRDSCRSPKKGWASNAI